MRAATLVPDPVVVAVLAEKFIPVALRGFRVGVLEATQDRGCADSAARLRVRGRAHTGLGDLLRQALVGPLPVEVRHVFVENTPQVALAQDDDMVQALAPDAAEEPLTGGVLSRGPIGGPQLGDATRRRDPGEGLAILAVVIADQVARALVERGGLPQLLRDPGVGRVARHAHVHHAARAKRNDAEGVHGAEEEVGDREEVARPDVLGVVAQEGRPILAGAARRSGLAQVALDRRLGDADVELEEFTPDALGAPEGIGLSWLQIHPSSSRCPPIGVVQAAEDGHRVDWPVAAPGHVARRCGCRLRERLVRAVLVEVRHVLAQHTMQVALTEDEQVIQALAAHACLASRESAHWWRLELPVELTAAGVVRPACRQLRSVASSSLVASVATVAAPAACC
ncbi:MAG TPA: hypothetical protein VLA19_00915 [Herpetosiphonaceae bacterium]|nr:hypothetical protein [Herpetosiphonaceae bacterium]